jgi:transglutaminase-like putative cysteine protease
MVMLAGSTLWITQQLAVWAMLIQALAIAVSYWSRHQPYRWQLSPIALNLGMLFVTSTTIQVALQGGPATLGLAHFAALAQGLQLLDARPRRTEFLLVALALFQVILASNLTDSVFFTPLLVAFLFATVWTLLVHTLRSEASEAADVSVGHAITPGLLRVTLIASSASVALAMVLFMLLPRLHSSVLRGSALGPTLATAGFTDSIALGTLGTIRQDSTVVLRIETLEGTPPPFANAYWSGLAFDHFDGTTWSVSSKLKYGVAGAPEMGVTLTRDVASPRLVQRIVREPVAGSVLFTSGIPHALQGGMRVIERDANGGLYAAGQGTDRIRYTVTSEPNRRVESALMRDAASPPPRATDRFLQLPALSPRVAELARSITATARSDAERMALLENYLLTNGRYSDTPPALDEDSGVSPLESFLFEEMSAHCEYYATALVVLARSVGIPSRLVNGFAGGRTNAVGDFVELSRSHAHAWVDVHYALAGWVRYDATPPDLRQSAIPTLSLAARVADLASAVEYWWFQRVVGFDRSDQMGVLKRAWLAWRGDRKSNSAATSRAKARAWGLDPEAWRDEVLALLALGACGIALWRFRSRGEADAVPGYYRRALQILARRGIVRESTVSARDFVAHVTQQVPPAAGAAFGQITEFYLAERFGQRADLDATVPLRRLREAVRLPA